MIKRQFYSLEHCADDNAASSESFSSSSSAASGDAVPSSSAEDEVHEDDDGDVASSPREEFQCTDSVTDKSLALWKKQKKSSRSDLSNQSADLVAKTLNEEASGSIDKWAVSCKSVLKCRLCPKIICLTTESMQAHLNSKKHARSLKLMRKGRLKVMLNSDGEEEEQGETHSERHARILESFQKSTEQHLCKRKREAGRQRQRMRAKKRQRKERKVNK